MSSKTGALYATNQHPSNNSQLDIQTVQFVPRKVVVTNLTTLVRLEWSESMADDSALQIVAAGDTTLITSDGITPLDGVVNPGFRLKALTNFNDTTTEILLWECWS